MQEHEVEETEEGEQGGEAAGTIHIGANHGTITRTEGLFSGGDRTAVVDEQADEPNPDAGENEENDADENIVKRRIKEAFREGRDEVKQTFYKVRRSFVDFFKDK